MTIPFLWKLHGRMIVVFIQQLSITSTENQPLNYRPSDEEQEKAVKTSVRTVKKFIQALISHSSGGWGCKGGGEGVFSEPGPYSSTHLQSCSRRLNPCYKRWGKPSKETSIKLYKNGRPLRGYLISIHPFCSLLQIPIPINTKTVV